MKKLVRIWFPVLKIYSEDMIVNIPDGIDSLDWLANERYELVKNNSEFNPDMQFFRGESLSILFDLNIVGAKFIESGDKDPIVES